MEGAMLRDMNKARIGFHGAGEVASGHWGCGAYGNNHNLMFLKQWLAASEAGATKLWYHDYGKDHSHHCVPLIRRLKHLTVGQLWRFLRDELTADLRPCKMRLFYQRVCDIAVGRLKVPAAAGGEGDEAMPATGAAGGDGRAKFGQAAAGAAGAAGAAAAAAAAAADEPKAAEPKATKPEPEPELEPEVVFSLAELQGATENFGSTENLTTPALTLKRRRSPARSSHPPPRPGYCHPE